MAGSDSFEFAESPTSEPGEGEVLMRIVYLSLDPYMRCRMSAEKSYAAPAAVGQSDVSQFRIHK
jgi:NADPH-dependent curcumin reductase CurA